MERNQRAWRSSAWTQPRARWAAALTAGILALGATAVILNGAADRRAAVDSAAASASRRGEIAVETARSGLVISPDAIDIGDVPMDVSEVALEFSVTNHGDEVQVITYLETSCDCTTASLVVDGREGPRFAMRHATPPGSLDWRAVLAPGEEATLMVYYDPQAHGVLTPEEAPQIHGPATRIVRVHSDDAYRAQSVDLRIDLNQRH